MSYKQINVENDFSFWFVSQKLLKIRRKTQEFERI